MGFKDKLKDNLKWHNISFLLGKKTPSERRTWNTSWLSLVQRFEQSQLQHQGPTSCKHEDILANRCSFKGILICHCGFVVHWRKYIVNYPQTIKQAESSTRSICQVAPKAPAGLKKHIHGHKSWLLLCVTEPSFTARWSFLGMFIMTLIHVTFLPKQL